MQGSNDFFVYTRAYATFRAKVIKITYRSMVGQFLGKITSWEKSTAVLQKKKKGYKNPLNRIKNKEKDTHGKRFNAPFVCVLMVHPSGAAVALSLPCTNAIALVREPSLSARFQVSGRLAKTTLKGVVLVHPSGLEPETMPSEGIVLSN